MALTVGSGPFGKTPGGRHNAQVPDPFVLVEPFGRRVRAARGGRAVVDSDDVSLVSVTGALPRYSFPDGDVSLGPEAGVAHDPHVPGNVIVPWKAADAWYEEDERVFVHPRDPYHRVDVLLTSRVVEVRIGPVELARSTRCRALYETGLPARWYVPRVDVRMTHLLRSHTVTECPYKGTAHYWSTRQGEDAIADVAWSYEEDALREGTPIQWHLAFDDTKVEVLVDGVRQGT